MITWLRRSRLLRLCLVALLVPMMVLTSGSGAQAAAQGVRFTHTFPGSNLKGTLLSDVTCSLSLVFGAGEATVSGECVGGPDLTPFMTTPGEPGSHASFRLAGDGEVQGNNSMTVLQDHDRDGVGSVAGTIIETSVTFGAEFKPTQLCMSLGPPGLETKFTSTQCTPVAYDVGECELTAQVARPVVGGIREMYDGARNFRINSVTGLVTGSTGDWSIYTVYEAPVPQPATTYSWLGTPRRAVKLTTEYPFKYTVPFKTFTAGPVSHTHWIQGSSTSGTSGSIPATPGLRVVGVGIVKGLYETHSMYYLPQNEPRPGAGLTGVTKPGACAFYWGEKIAQTPDDDFDEPMGPLEPPPAEELPEEEPDAPDEENWWSALWGLLKSIAAAIWAIPQAILDGLGGLFEALFIPSPGFLDDALGDLRDQADDSNIGEWNDAFSGLFTGGASAQARGPAGGGEGLIGGASFSAQSAPSGLDFGGGGCQGPSVDMSMITPDGMGGEFDTLHPFSACDGIAAEMSSWSRLLSTLFLALFGAFKMFGLVASASFGLKQTEIMRGFDWNSDRLDGRSM